MGPLRLKLALAPPLWRGLARSLHIPAPENLLPSDPQPLIFACLHRDILGSILFVRPFRPYLLVSDSDDGLILVRTLGESHYRYIRGATGENAGRALVRLRRVLEEGASIGLAVDGPKGPFGEIRAGVLQLARWTGATVVPLRPVFNRSLTLGTWDRTILPVPFSSFRMEVGPLISIPSDADDAVMARERARLVDFLLEESGGAP